MRQMIWLGLSLHLLLQGCGPARQDIATGSTADAGTRLSFAAEAVADLPPAMRNKPLVLALSGGGPDGAFGAGDLSARADAGCRAPDIVTGVSIGALIGTLVFAARQDRFETLFACGGLTGIAPAIDPLRGLISGTLSDGAGYRLLVAQAVDADVIARVAAEHGTGRRLYVPTTDLDLMQMTAWDMGAIATLPDANADALFKKVLVTSASIPGLFPTVPLPSADGEMRLHVDGDVAGQIFVPELPRAVRKPRIRIRIRIIVNNGLSGDPPLTRLTLFPTLQRGLSTLIRTQSRNRIELGRLEAERAGGEVEAI